MRQLGEQSGNSGRIQVTQYCWWQGRCIARDGQISFRGRDHCCCNVVNDGVVENSSHILRPAALRLPLYMSQTNLCCYVMSGSVNMVWPCQTALTQLLRQSAVITISIAMT